MLFNKLKTAAAVLLMVIVVGIGVGTTALLAADKSARVGYQYQPAGIRPQIILSGITTQPEEVALDAAGGRAKPYLNSPPDPTNINHLWKLTTVGDYYMLESKVGELALDANGGRGNPYLRHSDPTNINHLWKLKKVDECYLILPKVGEDNLALDANAGKGSPYYRKPDTTNTNLLWELRKTGNYHMIIPLVRRMNSEPKQETERDLNLRQEIETLVKRAEEAGGDRSITLDAIEKTVKEMKGKAMKKDSPLP